MTQKTLVEVSVPQADGTTLPYGIMNADQAAGLCDETFQKDVAHEPEALGVSIISQELTAQFIG
ncbi:hypothetical protein J2T09_003503 [Neorhizobium huautlense]|uniref:Uncharacterized protein n=1 Tax=Neorhizobium huautlense TaxID=67774 RepID=A0ABT9PX66_9HYPH|nr:hypothetical protein [Neorhizobium huautlense]MDP9838731.1 hypothetical protein [Neorhizobium huautlense]